MKEILYVFIDALNLGLPYALLALGIFISYRLLDFADLTAEGSFTLGGTVVISAIVMGVNPILATILAAFSGFLAGIITGVLHTKLKIPNLLSGIITMTGLFTINMVIMGIAKNKSYDNLIEVGNNKTIFSYLNFFDTKYYNNIITALLIVVIILCFVYWFFGTEIGMSIRATGMNKNMARAQGINTTIMIILGLAISNALISIGGSLLAQQELRATANMGVGALVIGLASIIIGEAVFGKKTFKNWIISVVLGSIVYFLIVCAAIQLGLPTHYKNLLYAIIISIVLSIPLISNFIKKKRGVAHVKNK